MFRQGFQTGEFKLLFCLCLQLSKGLLKLAGFSQCFHLVVPQQYPRLDLCFAAAGIGPTHLER